MRTKTIYLDHQASTPLHPESLAAMQLSFIEHMANPHSTDHVLGWVAADAVEEARRAVAGAIGADPDEVYFTSGATEANNIALLGLKAGDSGRKRLVISNIEHKAVLGPAREVVRRSGELILAPSGSDGVIDLETIRGLIDADTRLVSVMLVNNEIGTVQPVAKVAEMCRSAGAILHVDASQALAWMPIDVLKLGADMVSLSAHKMGGPKGVGALFVRREVRQWLEPLFFGGEQENGLRPGTIPVPLCVGFGAACHALPNPEEVSHWRERTLTFEKQLTASLPGAFVNGAKAERHPGSISLTLPGRDAELIIARLQSTVSVSRGSACTSGTVEPSHVLRAIGLTPSECHATMRISPGRFTSEEELSEAHNLIVAAARLAVHSS